MVATDQQTAETAGTMSGIVSANSAAQVPVSESSGALGLMEQAEKAECSEKVPQDYPKSTECNSGSTSQGHPQVQRPTVVNMAHSSTGIKQEVPTDVDQIDAASDQNHEMHDISSNDDLVLDEEQYDECEEDGNIADVSDIDPSSVLDVDMSYVREENAYSSASEPGNLSSEYDVDHSYTRERGNSDPAPIHRSGKASHGSTCKQSEENPRQRRQEVQDEETEESSDGAFDPDGDTRNDSPRTKRREVRAGKSKGSSDSSFELSSDARSESAGSSYETAYEDPADRVKVEPEEDSQHKIMRPSYDRSHSQGNRRLLVTLAVFLSNGIAKMRARSVRHTLSSGQDTEWKTATDHDDDMPLLKRSRPKGPGTAGHHSDYSRISGQSPSSRTFTQRSLTPETATRSATFGAGNYEDDEEESDAEEGDTPTISWKLPEYEIIRTNDPSEEVPSAKVSLPGLVREPIMLGLEFPDLMFRLIKEVFLPSHARTWNASNRDPEPQFSLLNFCVIADIFVSVFHNFQQGELGGVFGGVLPKDADPDQVFFAALDNWRVGREMKRKKYESIRGIQEFCDVGLEVLWWVKQNWDGEEEKIKRKARSDKGVKRGPRASKDGGAKATNTLVAKPKAKGKSTEKTKGKKAEEKVGKAGQNKVKTGRVTKKQKK